MADVGASIRAPANVVAVSKELRQLGFLLVSLGLGLGFVLGNWVLGFGFFVKWILGLYFNLDF